MGISVIVIVIVISRSFLRLNGLLPSIASSGCLISKGLCCGRDSCGAVAPCPIDV
jgi:hypothetical protein